MIESKNRVDVHEINGKEPGPADPADDRVLYVNSHWNLERLVVLQYGTEGKTITVAASDLITATNNATNSNRHH